MPPPAQRLSGLETPGRRIRVIDRTPYLLAGANRTTRIVEVGPSHAPIAPKAEGWRTTVIDHAPAAELREKYAALGVDISRIEEVDAVWSDGAIADAFPAHEHGSFDLLIASHVIEHVPDFIGFFTSAGRLLNQGGQIALAVPDKRYCFDALRPWTTTGDLLQAKGAARHNLRTAWNQVAYAATADGAFAWGQHDVAALRLVSSFATSRLVLRGFTDDPAAPYQDNHAWQFTPSSFALGVFELGLLGEIEWHVADITPAQGCEFLVTMRRGRPDFAPARTDAMRSAYLRAMMNEMVAGLAHFAAADIEPPHAPDEVQ